MSDTTTTTDNLDAMTKGEPHAYCMDHSRPGVLRDYAYTRLMAMEHMRAGRIKNALRVEYVLADMYAMLPPGMRW